MNITTAELQSVLDDHLAKLVACGDGEALALHLQTQNIKALCGNTGMCALALSFDRALTEAFPGTHHLISVSNRGMSVYGLPEWVSTSPFPEWMSEFVDNFDKGRYPALMAKNAMSWDDDSEVLQ